MKRILSCLLVLALWTTMLVLPANAAAEVSGTCGELTWSIDYLNSNHDSTLTITGLGAIPDYTADAPAPWYEYREYIKFVDILGGVSGIGNYAFKDCSTVTRFKVADSVKAFGDHAFDSCSALQSMSVPSSVRNLGNGVFYNCTSVTSVVLPNLIKTIPDDMFYNCSKLEYTTISYNVSSIGNNAFYGCTSLEKLEIPTGISSIGNNAFYGCTGLQELDFKCEAPTIGENAFGGVTATFYYPQHSPTWSESALQNYGGTITWVEKPNITRKGTFGDDITWTLDYYGYLTLSGTGEMYGSSSADWYNNMMAGNVVDHIIIEEGITGICAYAFKYCGYVQSVSIPSTVKEIGSSAFSFSTDLTNIYIADLDSWLNIEFANQYSNPLACTTVDKNLYIGGEKVTELVFSADVTAIADYAFYYCKNIESITFEGDMPEFGYDCFSGVTATGWYPANNDTWNELDMMSNHGGNITWKEYVNVIASGECGDDVTWTLDDTGTLTISGTGPMSNNEFGPWYDYQESIKKVIIQSGVTTIGGGAFSDCENLTAVTIPDSVTTIGRSAFKCCTSLTEVVIPESVTVIDGYAFYQCTSLNEVIIPDSVTGIGDCSFAECESLSAVTIGNSVTSIGLYGFSRCTVLADVYYTGTQEQWDAISIKEGNEPLLEATLHVLITEAPGDLDGVEGVNEDDVIYLLQHLLMPDDFPL